MVVTLQPQADARSAGERGWLRTRGCARSASSGARPHSSAFAGRTRIWGPRSRICTRRRSRLRSRSSCVRVSPRGRGRRSRRRVRLWPGVENAESDEHFEKRFRDAVGLVRNAGFFLGAVLTIAAILSVASAVRLALDLHREEVGIMRLMGATEGAIRAPFWLCATAEGLLGGGVALGLLYATYRLAAALAGPRPAPGPLGLLDRVSEPAGGPVAARGGRGRGSDREPVVAGEAAHAAGDADRVTSFESQVSSFK